LCENPGPENIKLSQGSEEMAELICSVHSVIIYKWMQHAGIFAPDRPFRGSTLG